MAKDLRLDVVTTSDGKGLLETAAEADLAADKIDKLGDQMRQTAKDGGILAIELEATKEQLKTLGAQFDYTGDKTLLKQISTTRRYSGQLERLRKDMEELGQTGEQEARKAGADLAKDVESGMMGEVGDVPTMVPILIGALTSPGTYAILADVGEMMGGAVLTGIGLAGIGAGVALSLDSPPVQAATDRLTQHIQLGLSDAASSFVAPLAGAVDTIDAEFSQLLPGIKADFAEIAPEVDALGTGAAGFLDEVVPALGEAVVAAKPLVDLFAQELPDLGRVLGGLFQTMADHSGEAEVGLQDLINLVETLINFVAGSIVILSDLGDAANEVELQAASGAKELLDLMIQVADAAHIPDQGLKNLDEKLGVVVARLQANQQMAEGTTLTTAHLGAAAVIAASNVDELATQLDNFNIAMSTMDGLLDRTEALNNLTIGMSDFVKQLKDSKGAFDANTAAGATNQNSYIGLIKKAEEYRDSLIESGVSQAAADLAFQNMVKQIDAVADKAGWSATQIADLNKQLGVTAEMAPIDVHVNVKTAYTYTGRRPNLGTDIPFLADGGHFDPGPIVVGEDGPEILWPDSPGTVIPDLKTGSTGGHTPVLGGGGGTTVICLHLDGGMRALVTDLGEHIRTSYGGNVQVALGGHS